MKEESSSQDMEYILVVDDIAENRLALKSLLESPNTSVVEASSGEEALRLALNHPYALILLDVMMPEMDGFETAILLRLNPQTRDIPIIFVTAFDQKQEYMFKGYETGAVDYIVKPVDPQILRSKVQVFCQLHRLVQKVQNDLAIQKQTEKALQESEQRFINVLYASNDAILLLDGETFVDCNEATVKMLKYANKKEFLMTHPSQLSPPRQADGRDSFEKANEMIHTALKGGFHRFEWIHRRCNGEDFPVEVSLTPIVVKGKTMLHCIWRDITAQKVLESKVALSGKMESIGQLASGIAHEINTPAQFIGDNIAFIQNNWPVIQNALKLILEEYEKCEALKENKSIDLKKISFLSKETPQALNDAAEGVQRITTIVKAMREFAHPHDTKAVADINHAIESTVTVARNEWKYVADLELDLDKSLAPISCFMGDLNQVFLNMIVNAAQAIAVKIDKSTDKGKIWIRTKQLDKKIRIEIEDNGPGIPEDIRTRIFDPFFTTKGVGKGTGQGLYISHQIVEQKHGGHIAVESKLGEGSKFIIEIPIE